MALDKSALSAPARIDRALSVRQMLLRFGITHALNDDVTELAINRPGEYWIERDGRWVVVDNDNLTLSNLQSLATAVAVYNKKTLDVDSPIESLQLPDGERCQIVLPPATLDGTISFTIRKPSRSRFSLDDYAQSGRLSPKLASGIGELGESETALLALAHSGQFEAFFRMAVDRRLNIVTVGGTGSGKTTFSKALIDLYPTHRRIITVEDAHELDTPNHPNNVHLFFGAIVTAKELLASCMRMKPDHIFVTELRGDETWDYLMALKSGHPGSITSVHANDCWGALTKIASYVKQSTVGQTLPYEYIMREIETTIDVVCFFENTRLKELYFEPRRKIELLKGGL